MRIDSNAQGMKTNNHAQKSEVPVKIITEQPRKRVQDSDNFTDFAHKPVQELTMDERQWIKLMERANKAIEGANKTFEYSVHEQTREIMITVRDRDTNEVLVEIPSEKILNMVAKMWEMAGLLVDERR